ncbi:unnamed protein product [Peniophora sp. CBMAI 1063]|nr:unnamed protein product [Peniophora sp. CBMAI 1063]
MLATRLPLSTIYLALEAYLPHNDAIDCSWCSASAPGTRAWLDGAWYKAIARPSTLAASIHVKTLLRLYGSMYSGGCFSFAHTYPYSLLIMVTSRFRAAESLSVLCTGFSEAFLIGKTISGRHRPYFEASDGTYKALAQA